MVNSISSGNGYSSHIKRRTPSSVTSTIQNSAAANRIKKNTQDIQPKIGLGFLEKIDPDWNELPGVNDTNINKSLTNGLHEFVPPPPPSQDDLLDMLFEDTESSSGLIDLEV